jgi:beta-N-acetylhexosaminidase
MKALSGDFADRTRRSLDAGCDVVLHCNGDMGEMQAVAAAARALEGRPAARAAAALARVAAEPAPFDAVRGRAELEAALAGIWAA